MYKSLPVISTVVYLASLLSRKVNECLCIFMLVNGFSSNLKSSFRPPGGLILMKLLMV